MKQPSVRFASLFHGTFSNEGSCLLFVGSRLVPGDLKAKGWTHPICPNARKNNFPTVTFTVKQNVPCSPCCLVVLMIPAAKDTPQLNFSVPQIDYLETAT